MPQQSPLLNLRRQNSAATKPAAEAFFQSIAARLRARMVNRSATDIPIRTSGVEVRSLGEVFQDPEYREGGVHGALLVGGARMPGAILMQHSLLSRLISVLLGQALDDVDAPTQIRSLSPVERRIASRLCGELVNEVVASWPERPAPHVQFAGLTASAQGMDSSITTVPVYSATFDFGPVDAPLGLLTLALPLHALGSLAAGMQEEEEEDAAPPRRRRDLSVVMPVEVELVVELTQLSLTVDKLRTLSNGDVVELGVMREALLKVNGLPLFEGEAGIANGMRCIKINRRVRS